MRASATLWISQQLLPWLLETAAMRHNYRKVGFMCFAAWRNTYWLYSSFFATFWTKLNCPLPWRAAEHQRADLGTGRVFWDSSRTVVNSIIQGSKLHTHTDTYIWAALEEAWGLVVPQEVGRCVVHEFVQQRLCPHRCLDYLFQSHVECHITFLTDWSKSCQAASTGKRMKILPATLISLKAGSWLFFFLK